MSSTDNTSYIGNLALSASLGAARAVLVSTVTQPIETVKCLVQCSSERVKVTKVVSDVITKEGIIGFYKKGYLASLGGVTIKQLWRWPVIMSLPPALEKRNVSPLTGQFATATALATTDALAGPFEKLKILFMVNRDMGHCAQWSWKIFRAGWKGVPSYWLKLMVNWNACLISQKLYRDRYKIFVKREQLTLPELACIGVLVGITVSFFSAPVDYMNTHVLGLNKKISDFRPRMKTISFREIGSTLAKVKVCYRGISTQSVALIIHNVSTVVLIEWLSPLFYQKIEPKND